jgi:hypothetical protein
MTRAGHVFQTWRWRAAFSLRAACRRLRSAASARLGGFSSVPRGGRGSGTAPPAIIALTSASEKPISSPMVQWRLGGSHRVRLRSPLHSSGSLVFSTRSGGFARHRGFRIQPSRADLPLWSWRFDDPFDDGIATSSDEFLSVMVQSTEQCMYSMNPQRTL